MEPEICSNYSISTFIGFFNSADQLTSLLLVVFGFGASSAMRPVGSIIVGAYVDCHGWKGVMLLAILILLASGAFVGFTLPSGSIGIAAPLLNVLGCLLLGFSADGDCGASTTPDMESEKRTQRVFSGGWRFFSQRANILRCSVLAQCHIYYILSKAIKGRRWCVLFWLTLAIIPVVLYICCHIGNCCKTLPIIQDRSLLFGIFIKKHLKQTISLIDFTYYYTCPIYKLVYFVINYRILITKEVKSALLIISIYTRFIVNFFVEL